MSRAPTGSIDQLPSGRWRVRITVDGERRPLPTFATEEEAREKLRAVRAEIARGVVASTDRLTLGGYGTEWLDRRELFGSRARAEVKGIRQERSLWRRHVLTSPIADIPLGAVAVRDIDDLVLWLRRREAVDVLRGGVERKTGRVISTQVQRHVLRLVRGALNDAVAREIIDRNPADMARVRGGTSKDLDEDWLRADEIDRLLRCEAIAPWLRTAYACALGLALRQSDLRTLRVDAVRLDDPAGPHVRVRVGKSEKWHRVPVLPWLEPALRQHLATLGDSEYVFPAHGGEPYASGFDFSWREKLDRSNKTHRPSALALAGVDRRIRFHDLRGTCATHLALGTWGRQWSLREVQAMLAHSDQRVTERYVRRAHDELARAARETTGGPGHLVTFGHGPKSENPVSAGNHSARLGGLEPPTVGLEGPSAPESFREVTPAVTDSVTKSGVAAAIITLAQAGTLVPRALLETLAASVLERPEVRLALAIQEGSPHDVRQALELIALLDAQAPSRAEEETG